MIFTYIYDIIDKNERFHIKASQLSINIRGNVIADYYNENFYTSKEYSLEELKSFLNNINTEKKMVLVAKRIPDNNQMHSSPLFCTDKIVKSDPVTSKASTDFTSSDMGLPFL